MTQSSTNQSARISIITWAIILSCRHSHLACVDYNIEVLFVKSVASWFLDFSKKRDSVSLEGPRRSLITAPRFANISENSEEDDAVVTSPSRPRSIQKRSGGLLNDSSPRETEHKPKKKTFEIVDSDDDDDDDDDDAIVSRPRRSLDTGLSQKRPSLTRSSRAASPSASSPREVLESSKDEAPQRPGLSRSKRPLSAKRPSLDGNGGSDNGERKNSRASSSRKSSLPVGSDEDSDDGDVVVTGKKTKVAGGDKKPARPSLTRKSPTSTRKWIRTKVFILDTKLLILNIQLLWFCNVILFLCLECITTRWSWLSMQISQLIRMQKPHTQSFGTRFSLTSELLIGPN